MHLHYLLKENAHLPPFALGTICIKQSIAQSEGQLFTSLFEVSLPCIYWKSNIRDRWMGMIGCKIKREAVYCNLVMRIDDYKVMRIDDYKVII